MYRLVDLNKHSVMTRAEVKYPTTRCFVPHKPRQTNRTQNKRAETCVPVFPRPRDASRLNKAMAVCSEREVTLALEALQRAEATSRTGSSYAEMVIGHSGGWSMPAALASAGAPWLSLPSLLFFFTYLTVHLFFFSFYFLLNCSLFYI